MSGITQDQGADVLGDQIIIEGGTDGTKIGNVGDALKTTATLNVGPADTPGAPVITKKLRYEVDRTTVVLNGTYQTIWSYTGSGKFIGIVLDTETNLTDVKFTVDGTEVIWEFKLSNLQANSGNKEFSLNSLYTNAAGKVLVFTPGADVVPILYESSLKLEAKESTGKRVFGYVVGLTKET